jgi:hypothetical protein
MYSLVPLAQLANSPIDNIGSSDGLVGSQYAQKEEYVVFIKKLSQALIDNLALK